MRTLRLGRRGPVISPLCFGTLTMGPLQQNLSPEAGGQLIAYAARQGVMFVDTAEIYGTYAHIAQALQQVPDLVIATKCYAHDRPSAQRSLEKAQEELGRETIDVFLLHEQESCHTLRGHAQALAYFAQMREAGVIRAIGISTHHVAAVAAAIAFGKEFGGLDVVHPILNRAGLGIVDGTREQMEQAVAQAYDAGIGVYAMKALGGGHLIEDAQGALDYARNLPFVHAVAVGMQSRAEIDANAAFFEGRTPDAVTLKDCERAPRRLLIHDWCEGCGACVRRCGQGALALKHGKAWVDQDKCTRCGYCAGVCAQFCIKVI